MAVVNLSKYGPAAVARGYNTYAESVAQAKTQGRKDFLKGVVLPIAAFATGGAAGAAFGGAGAAGGSGIVGPLSGNGLGWAAAPTAGKFTLGSLLGSRGAELAAGLGTSYMAQRSQNKANQYATDSNAALTREQLAMERDRIMRAEADDKQDRIDAERRWIAEQAFQKSQFDANEEDRRYTRSISDRNLRLDDEREARAAPYRAYSERALRTLGQILGIG